MTHPIDDEPAAQAPGLIARVRRRIAATSWQVVAAVVSGVLLLVAGLVIALTSGSDHKVRALPPTPPSPESSTSASAPTTSSSRDASPSPSSSSRAYRCEHPKVSDSGVGAVHLCIPAIDVNADVIPLGLNADHTVQVPTLAQVKLAGWYKYSPAPGVIGPSVILGHVDSAQYGDGVFFDLGKLHGGDKVAVERADGMIATYRVTGVAEYSKKAFPTQKIYGNTAKATLRLITCGGTFDPAAGSYEDNIVAYGTLVSLKRG